MMLTMIFIHHEHNIRLKLYATVIKSTTGYQKGHLYQSPIITN